LTERVGGLEAELSRYKCDGEDMPDYEQVRSDRNKYWVMWGKQCDINGSVMAEVAKLDAENAEVRREEIFFSAPLRALLCSLR